jgi:amino acid transporter
VAAGVRMVSRIVSLITGIVVALIVIGIVLVLLEANKDNQIVSWLLDGGEFLVEPFDNVFKPDGEKAKVAVNWGLAAVIYAIVGGLIARLLRRRP